jgi:4-amino-4-deoxy-L-arabinose transferase-like glycosyltransferase
MGEEKSKWIIRYFRDWKNILTFVFLILLVAAGFYLRIRNLGYLSFWGDDGHTVIGTLSILKHGYPLLPSGYVLFHSILDYYLNVIPVLIFGPTEFAFRLTSVVFGCGTIILVYFAGKELINKFAGFLAAAAITFSTWYIYFSREARYFSALQFFFLISVYFFYKGFVKEQKPFRILAVIFFILSPLIHGNAFFLIFAFIALIFYKGRRFFRRQTIIPFLIILVLYTVQILNQVLFWKVGRSFYSQGEGLRGLLDAYFRIPDPYYFKILNMMFPEMFILFIAGTGVFIGLSIFISLKKNFSFSDMYLNENEITAGKARFPFNIIMLYFMFILTIIIISFGQMYNQQRYIYFLMPLFVLIYTYTVYVFSFAAVSIIRVIYRKISKKDLKKPVFAGLLTVIFIIISFFSLSGIDLREANAIPSIKHSDRLNTMYSISNVMSTHWDAAVPGKYVAENMDEDDIVITTDVYNSYPYTKKIDYWLWSGNLASWRPYHLDNDGKIRDDTYGVELIRDIYKFIDVFNSNNNKDIWLIGSYSLGVPEHVDPVFRQFLDNNQDKLILTGRDNVARLYYFPKTSGSDRISIKDFIPPVQENTLKPDGNGVIYIDLSDPESNDFLITGWGNVEANFGTWGIGDRSILYVSFKGSRFDIDENSQLSLVARPLPHPELTQTIDFVINSELIDRVSLVAGQDFGQYDIKINRNRFSEDINVLEFIYSYSFTPKELGLAPDNRNLSVLFKSVEIYNPE